MLRFNCLKLIQRCLHLVEGACIGKFALIPAVRAPSAVLVDVPDVIPHEPIFGSQRGHWHQITFRIEQPDLHPRKSGLDSLTNLDPVRQIDLYDEIPFILTVLGSLARVHDIILWHDNDIVIIHQG